MTKCKMLLLHGIVFFVEIWLLLSLVSVIVLQPTGAVFIVHDHLLMPIFWASFLFSISGSLLCCILCGMDVKMLRVKFAIGLVALCIVLAIGIVFRIGDGMSGPKTPNGWNDRLSFFGGVEVTFDADGGVCDDQIRIAKVGQSYGRVMNVYPSENADYLVNAQGIKVDLHNNKYIAMFKNDTSSDMFIDYFTTNAIPITNGGESWTYVVDAEEVSGDMYAWVVGQSLPTNHNVYAQLSEGRVSTNILTGMQCFLVLESTSWKDKCNMLDRAYLHVKPGQSGVVKFRVSLFSGRGVSAKNYHYAKPGDTIACSLPIPTRPGYVFCGWFDGTNMVTDASIVEKFTPHMLKAKWSVEFR